MNWLSKRLFWAVNLAHLTNDIFMSMRGVLLAFLSVYMLPMSNRQIGLALSAGEIVGAVSQPFFGWIADRTGGRWLGALGVGWTVSLLMASMLVVLAGGSFWLMLIPFALAALGSGAFHPVGSMHATDTLPTRVARNSSIFFLFGQLGLGVGPALAGLLLDNAHTKLNDWYAAGLGPAFHRALVEHGSVAPILLLWITVIPAVIAMALAIPNRAVYAHKAARPTGSASTRSGGAFPVKAFLILGLAVTLRSLANPATVSFIPRMFQLKGWTPAQYGLLTSSFWVASGITLLLFGYLAARFDHRRLIMVSMLLSAPPIFLLPSLDGFPAYAMAIAIGGLTGGAHSLIVVLAQRLLPGRKGLASGLILGFIFATGALGNLVIGDLADRFGASGAFQLVAIITAATSLLWLWLPAAETKPARVAQTEPEAVAA
jgi:FSR family fosmidomycin resistance protein-like MFS transporter